MHTLLSRFRSWLLAALFFSLCATLPSCLSLNDDDVVVDNTDYAARDEEILQAYIKANNLTAQRQASGLYVVITQPGTGATPTAGQQVSVLYTGTTLDGKVFDSTASRDNKPFSFAIGRGQVIAGWDQGIALLNKGAKATLLIPSGLAYGSRGAGSDIAPNTVLRFDVELTDIK
ncbi:FKBP-type peptidyl-prolyl cis-trans isomerase [Hymenobacter mucosus]|uniref:Peptidyl-prolyl cis-trans isomerase n=1 Tax=Hymenobacter mucosus TaxID=1411120 RepID=A0A238ZPD7_9BACT|nr:FKBP-type peptidyl-prolyl cis-trans isomerase [Hymenobacter mucosus]SNR85316.1 FKBP-type peptidyl-prolyl cis-trans isomerase [Hymenobacter mucosus]